MFYLTLKSKFTPFWACPCHDSPLIEVTISKFGMKMHLSTVQIPTNFWLDRNWFSIQFSISNPDQIELFIYINKGSVPYCGSNDNNSTGGSLSEILFSLMFEKYIVCDACRLRSPSFESSSVLYITPTCTSSMQELIKQGMKQKIRKILLSMQEEHLACRI